MTTTLEYSILAGAAYFSTRTDINRFPIPQGWSELIDDRRANDQTGFEARAFQSGTEIVISYAGTDPNNTSLFAPDWQANFALVNGNWSGQLLQAAEYYLLIKAANPNATITLTGHSLGGGLAALVAVFFGVPASIFDQAPFAQSATALSDNAVTLKNYLVAKLSGGNRVYSDAVLAPLTDYLQVRGPNNQIPRAGLVSAVRVDGEFTGNGILAGLYSAIGNSPSVLTHGPYASP